jgi:AmiR/NasT family two-component response regulator
MATAAASPFRVKRMLALGCKAVVGKPMDEETFLAAVNAALDDS